jgi:hypothetical protein
LVVVTPIAIAVAQLRAAVARAGSRVRRVDALRIERACVAALAARDDAAGRILDALGVNVPAVECLCPAFPGPLCPQYPRLSRASSARLVIGETPSDLARGLTAREAHEWCLDGGWPEPATWLVRHVAGGGTHVRDMLVARWVVACAADPARWAALTEEREMRHGEREVRGRLIDRVDEIHAVDLAQGPRSGVINTFERAARRALASWEALHISDEEPLAEVPRWWRPLRCAQLLRTRAALIAEGRAQEHCAGSYAAQVARGDCHVVSICVVARGQVHHSTVELSPDGRTVRQHRARANSTPSALCERALGVLMRRRARSVSARSAC